MRGFSPVRSGVGACQAIATINAEFGYGPRVAAE
jgi:hypothetical protein